MISVGDTEFSTRATVRAGATVQSRDQRAQAIGHARSFLETINEKFPLEGAKRSAGSAVSYSLTGGYLVSEIIEHRGEDACYSTGAIEISTKLIHVYRHTAGVSATGYALDGIHFVISGAHPADTPTERNAMPDTQNTHAVYAEGMDGDAYFVHNATSEIEAEISAASLENFNGRPAWAIPLHEVTAPDGEIEHADVWEWIANHA